MLKLVLAAFESINLESIASNEAVLKLKWLLLLLCLACFNGSI